jgi:hypothetical protein
MRRLIQGRSVCNSERSAGDRGRARGELKTVRPGAATREHFLEGEGGKSVLVSRRGASIFDSLRAVDLCRLYRGIKRKHKLSDSVMG